MTKKEFAKLLFEKGVFTTRTEAEKKVDIIFDSIEKNITDWIKAYDIHSLIV